MIGRMRLRLSRRVARFRGGEQLGVSLWHEFHKPPYGGGNQFFIALGREMQRQGVYVDANYASPLMDVHICNSIWFDVGKFERASRRRPLLMMHRVDGPVGIYRGSGGNEDERIYELNAGFASGTVYQSEWCFARMVQLGFKPVNPVVIRNAVDPAIFHPGGRPPFSRKRKTRLVATAWSDNPRKGGPFFKSLEKSIDWGRFEFTFIGRTRESFEKIRHVPAQPSDRLAAMLRGQDIYVMASQSEACSNALLEALSCGLPVLYLDDGGNGELTGSGGLPFKDEQQAVANLDRLVRDYEKFQEGIKVDTIDVVAGKYISFARSLLASGD